MLSGDAACGRNSNIRVFIYMLAVEKSYDVGKPDLKAEL